MVLKPQDVLVLLKLIVIGRNDWTYNELALELGMSPAEVHAACKRALAARLAVKSDDKLVPHARNLEEFLIHGIRYVFVPESGGLSRGMPTAVAAPPMASHFDADDEPPPVWPDPDGEVRGESFSPLYKSAVFAARNDPALYELLALVDAIRGGRSRVHEFAVKDLKKRLGAATKQKDEVLMSNRDRIVIGGKVVVSRAALREVTRRYHIRRLVLFGSAARGELKPDSDIDLLVEFADSEAPSLGGMVEIQDAFSKLFGGRKVDVATPAILNNPYRQRAIEKDMKELYAA